MRRRRWLIVAAVAGCGRLGFDERVGEPLAVAPAVGTINPGARQPLAISGGLPPYELTLVGQGALVGETFVAPSYAGETLVRVTDDVGDTAEARVVYEGERLFLVGGNVGATASDGVLSSLDGRTWSEIGQLPAPRANGALVAFDDRLLYLGGLNAGGAATNTIFASSDGVQWTEIGTLPLANTGITATVHAGALWLVGGATSDGDSDQVWRSTDGATWAEIGRISGGRHEHDLLSRDGTLIVIGGHGNGFLDDVQLSADGVSWQQRAGVLTFAADFAASGVLAERVFRVCGAGCDETETSLDLATWTPAAPLPTERVGASVVGFRGQLLLIGGGLDVLTTATGAVWEVHGQLPVARTLTGVAQLTPR